MVWFTIFVPDWDPYVEDAVMKIGIDNFTDWVQHTTAEDEWWALIGEAGGEEKLRGSASITDSAQEKEARIGLSGMKKFLSDHQVSVSGFYKAMSYITHAEVRKAHRVNEAFQQVLEQAAD